MIEVLMAHLSWVLKHIIHMNYFKQVASPITAYHMHIKQGQACLILQVVLVWPDLVLFCIECCRLPTSSMDTQ